jgi:hypothetical protein
LVTTTVPGTAAKELLDKLDKSNGGEIYTGVWDKSELTKILLNPDYEDLLKQFFPESYKRVKGYGRRRCITCSLVSHRVT